MSLLKKLLFAVFTLGLIAGSIEGVARVVWWKLAKRAFEQTRRRGQEVLGADPSAVNFMTQPSGLYGYTLTPNFSQGDHVINVDGFAQRDVVPVERVPGKLRVAAMGESTTEGHHVDKGCYPSYLRGLLSKSVHGYDGVEVLNGGVSGWLSDQIALRAEHQMAAYKPDVVILYVGWNDFQGYDPYEEVLSKSIFDIYYSGSRFHNSAQAHCKSLALLSALHQKYARQFEQPTQRNPSADAPPEDIYHFYLKNLDRIVAAYRGANPHVRICLCTLIARWPLLNEDEFIKVPTGRTKWMQDHGVSREQAAGCMATFNALIRKYAQDHQLLLIDTGAVFESLDRSQLMWDLAHMTYEGYELLAEVMYDSLRQSGTVEGDASPRRLKLLSKYRRLKMSDGNRS